MSTNSTSHPEVIRSMLHNGWLGTLCFLNSSKSISINCLTQVDPSFNICIVLLYKRIFDLTGFLYRMVESSPVEVELMVR